MSKIKELERRIFLKRKKGAQIIKRNFSAHNKEKKIVFVTGVQRSGTNMLMTLFERSPNTEVFHEADERAFDSYIMRDWDVIKKLYRGSSAEVVVVKALHEAQTLLDLMGSFVESKAVWMFRDFHDVVNSQMHHWPGFKNKIDQLVVDRNSADWRGINMSDETFDVVRAHYYKDITVEDASALFWYYRNRIYFDQGMDKSPNILLVPYEKVVQNSDSLLPKIYRDLGMEIPNGFSKYVSKQSIRKHKTPNISREIENLCEEMSERLETSYQNKLDITEAKA